MKFILTEDDKFGFLKDYFFITLNQETSFYTFKVKKTENNKYKADWIRFAKISDFNYSYQIVNDKLYYSKEKIAE